MSLFGKFGGAASVFDLLAKGAGGQDISVQDADVPNTAEWAMAVHAKKDSESQPLADIFDPKAIKDGEWARQGHFLFWVLDQASKSNTAIEAHIGMDFDKALEWFDERITAEIGYDPSDPDEQRDFLNAVLELVGDDEPWLGFIGNDAQKALLWYRDYSVHTMGYSPDLDLGYDEPEFVGKMG